MPTLKRKQRRSPVATKHDVDTATQKLGSELRTEMQNMEKGIRGDMGRMDHAIVAMRCDMNTMEGRITKNVMEGTKLMLAAQKGEIFEEMERKMRTQKSEIIDEMMVLNEQLVHDFRGTLGDKISAHDDTLQRHDRRITRVETHLHLTA